MTPAPGHLPVSVCSNKADFALQNLIRAIWKSEVGCSYLDGEAGKRANHGVCAQDGGLDVVPGRQQALILAAQHVAHIDAALRLLAALRRRRRWWG